MRRIIWYSHAKERLIERGITAQIVLAALQDPDQVIPKGKIKIIHKRYQDSLHRKEYLLRIFVEVVGVDWVIRTVYRTSKIAKYWEGKK